MKNINKINILNKNKNRHVVLSERNYYKLKSLAKMGDSFESFGRSIVKKSKVLESDSRVGTREKTLTNSLPPVFKGDDKP